MRLTTLWGLCAMVLFTTSCGSDEVIENEKTEKIFALNSIIVQSEPTARAPQLNENGAGSFSSGDKNQLVFFSESPTVLKTFEYTYGNTYYWNDINLPSEVESCSMVAWYPAVSASNPESFDWNVVDQQENPDLLAATAVKVSPSSDAHIDLTFKHLMHKLQVCVVSENPAVSTADLQQATLTCKNILPIANVNLIKNSVTSAGGSVTSLSRTGAKTVFILPAQAVGSMEVVLNIKGKEAVFKLSEIQVNGNLVSSLESGKTLSINITVSKNGFIISGQTITGWEDQGSFEGDIII